MEGRRRACLRSGSGSRVCAVGYLLRACLTVLWGRGG